MKKLNNFLSQEILEYFNINAIKFITLIFYLLIIVFLSNVLDKNLFAEYSKIILLLNSILIISSSGFTIFFFIEFEKNKAKKKLFNFLFSNYILINFIFLLLIFIFKNFFYQLNFAIKENLFFFLLNSTYTLLYISLISKKNIGINKTTFYENLSKNFLYLITLFTIYIFFNELIINYIFIGYVLSCYLLSIILFFKNYNFILKYKMFNFTILYDLKENFRFFYSRIRQTIVSLCIVLEIYLPVIFLTIYQKNILLADIHIILTIYMLFSFITVNIDINLINRFIINKLETNKLMNSVSNYYLISILYVLISSLLLFLFWNFFNLHFLNNMFPFKTLTILLIISLYVFDYIFGPNYQLYVSITKNLNSYIGLSILNFFLGSLLLIYFKNDYTLDKILLISLIMILIRNIFLHLKLLKLKLNISLFSFKNISVIFSKHQSKLKLWKVK